LQDIRDAGLRQPVVLLPNGIDVPPLQRSAGAVDGRRRLLFLGRVHPIKGIELLLEAWAVLQARHPDWELLIAGKGDSEYVDGLQAMAQRLGLARLAFHGAVYGEPKHALFRSAELFVLPTHTENFGMAVAEALARGLPVITTRGAPWSGLACTGSGWWIERTLDALVAALDAAMSTEQQALAAMGGRGRDWMLRDFAWPAIAESMAASYRWLLSGGPRPACMHTE
jgi:glycosyltransferase involved in cell wall biosynthesis